MDEFDDNRVARARRGQRPGAQIRRGKLPSSAHRPHRQDMAHMNTNAQIRSTPNPGQGESDDPRALQSLPGVGRDGVKAAEIRGLQRNLTGRGTIDTGATTDASLRAVASIGAHTAMPVARMTMAATREASLPTGRGGSSRLTFRWQGLSSVRDCVRPRKIISILLDEGSARSGPAQNSPAICAVVRSVTCCGRT